MPFRSRPKQDPDAATLELARAREAMRYWEEQIRDATEEIAALSGVFGWIQVLTGNRERQLEEARQRQAAATKKLKAERMAFVKAQAAVEQEQQRANERKKAEDARLLDLEVVAVQLRDSDHPAAAQLDTLETELDRAEQQLQRLAEVLAAAGGLRAAIGQIERFALQVQTRVLGIAQGPQALEAYRKLGPLTARFHDACVDAGIEPPILQVPSEMLGRAARDPMYWLSGDHDWALEGLRSSLLDERDTINLIQMQAASERKQTIEARDAVYAKRRALLESVA